MGESKMDLVKKILFEKSSKVDFINNGDGSYTGTIEFNSIPMKETLQDISDEIYESIGNDWDIEISKLTHGKQIAYEITLSPLENQDVFASNQSTSPSLPIDRQIRDIDYQYALDFE